MILDILQGINHSVNIAIFLNMHNIIFLISGTYHISRYLFQVFLENKLINWPTRKLQLRIVKIKVIAKSTVNK